MSLKPKMSHMVLQQAAVDLLHMHGFTHLHARRSIGKGRAWTTALNLKGYPDLTAWSPRQPGRHLAIEVKVPPDSPTPEQRAVLAELAASGFECWVLTEDYLERFGNALRRPRTDTGSALSSPSNPTERTSP